MRRDPRCAIGGCPDRPSLFGLGDVAVVEKNLARGRDQELGQQLEASCLARAVGTDQCMDVATLHLRADVIDCGNIPAGLRQISRFEDISNHT
jgi:hypothetical protein